MNLRTLLPGEDRGQLVGGRHARLADAGWEQLGDECRLLGVHRRVHPQRDDDRENDQTAASAREHREEQEDEDRGAEPTERIGGAPADPVR